MKIDGQVLCQAVTLNTPYLSTMTLLHVVAGQV